MTVKTVQNTLRQKNKCRPGAFLLLLFLLWPAALFAAPTLDSVSPADGSVHGTPVWLEGQVTGAERLVIDGRDVALEEGRFRHGPIDAKDGERRLLLVLEDAEGEQKAVVHRLHFDRQPPRLTLERGPGVVNERSYRVSGTVIDRHLESLTIAGRPATLEGDRFSADVDLAVGRQSLDVVAIDVLGQSSHIELDVELDIEPPRLELLAENAALHGLATRRVVVPRVAAPDAETLELRLGGAPYERGAAIEDEGDYELVAVAYDAAGNRTTASARFTIARTPPRLEPSRRAGLDSGKSRVVKERRLTLEGTAEGAVSVTVDGVPARLDGDRYQAGPFELGAERIFTVLATDAAGNETRAELLYKSDPDAPVISLTTPAEGAVFASSPLTVSGVADDLDLASVTVAVNGGAPAPATLDGTSFTASVALIEGVNALTITATDALANESSLARQVTLDTTAPVINVTAGGAPLVEGAVFAGLVTPEVAVTDSTEVTLEATLDGIAWSPGTTVTTLGQHQLQITATDAAGHAASTLLSFTVEGAAPVFSALSPADGTVLSAAEVRLAGRALGAAALTIDGAPVALVGDDFTAGPFTLAEGPRSFSLEATSAGGQVSTATLTLTRDITAPALGFSQPADGHTTDIATVSVSGTVTELHLESLRVNGAPAQITGDAAAGATWSANASLVEGTNRVLVEAIDTAGNRAEQQREVLLDTRAPELEILEPAAGAPIAEATVGHRTGRRPVARSRRGDARGRRRHDRHARSRPAGQRRRLHGDGASAGGRVDDHRHGFRFARSPEHRDGDGLARRRRTAGAYHPARRGQLYGECHRRRLGHRRRGRDGHGQRHRRHRFWRRLQPRRRRAQRGR